MLLLSSFGIRTVRLASLLPPLLSSKFYQQAIRCQLSLLSVAIPTVVCQLLAALVIGPWDITGASGARVIGTGI